MAGIRHLHLIPFYLVFYHEEISGGEKWNLKDIEGVEKVFLPTSNIV